MRPAICPDNCITSSPSRSGTASYSAPRRDLTVCFISCLLLRLYCLPRGIRTWHLFIRSSRPVRADEASHSRRSSINREFTQQDFGSVWACAHRNSFSGEDVADNGVIPLQVLASKNRELFRVCAQRLLQAVMYEHCSLPIKQQTRLQFCRLVSMLPCDDTREGRLISTISRDST